MFYAQIHSFKINRESFFCQIIVVSTFTWPVAMDRLQHENLLPVFLPPAVYIMLGPGAAASPVWRGDC
jgi:hypothetical protein